MEDKILMWGDLALAKLTTQRASSEEGSLPGADDVTETLALHLTDGTLFRPDILNRSTQSFPQQLSLDPTEETFPELPPPKDSPLETPSGQELYDPRWVYPVLGHLLPHARVEFRKLVHSGILGYILAGLSSHTVSIREAAYTLLAFCHALLIKV